MCDTVAILGEAKESAEVSVDSSLLLGCSSSLQCL